MPARKPVKPITVAIQADSSQAMAALKALKTEAKGVAAALDNRPLKLRHVRKALTALAAGLLGWFSTCYVPDGHIDRAEWYALAVVVAGVAGVFAVPNATQIPAVQTGGSDDAEAGMGLLEFIVAVFALLILLVIGLAIAGRIH